jgi:GntR family transcriptional regulator, rspAB operon transcriptional repressor
MEKKKPKKTLARYAAYEAIKNKILYLEMRPGDVISEVQIAKNLSVGRTPAREALLLLEKEGLIEIKENVGFTVRKFGLQEIEEYRLIRTLIEEYAITMAIQRITKAEMKALKENTKRLKESVTNGNFLDSVKYESEFHEIIYNAARSDVVRETISGLNSKFLWLRAAALSKDGAGECLAEHILILEQIEKKDINRAKNLIRLHLKHGWGTLVNLKWLFGV